MDQSKSHCPTHGHKLVFMPRKQTMGCVECLYEALTSTREQLATAREGFAAIANDDVLLCRCGQEYVDELCPKCFARTMEESLGRVS